MKALIDENGMVCQVSDVEFGTAPPTFWVDCAEDVVAYQYRYVDGQVVPLPPPAADPPPNANENKRTAIKLLTDTDWVVAPDVGDQTKSSPYLSNVQDFIAYRNAVRQYAVNPIDGEINWPIKPQEVWV